MLITDEELAALMVQESAPSVPVLAPVPDGGAARRNPRWIVFELRANLHWRGQEYLVTVRDVSLSGMLLEISPKVMQVGTRGIVTIELEEYGLVVTPVEIVKVEEGNRTQQVGVKLSPCEPEDLELLSRYIADLSRTQTEMSAAA